MATIDLTELKLLHHQTVVSQIDRLHDDTASLKSHLDGFRSALAELHQRQAQLESEPPPTGRLCPVLWSKAALAWLHPPRTRARPRTPTPSSPRVVNVVDVALQTPDPSIHVKDFRLESRWRERRCDPLL
jgi:hypothetical protein